LLLSWGITTVTTSLIYGIDLNHGCSTISCMGILCFGSILRSFDIKSFAIVEKPLGHFIFKARIF
jgi:hypothetical protein